MKINLSDYKILVVDDIEANVLLLKVLLTNDGVNVITANNGKDAIRKVESELPDLILLDVLMPNMTGFEVCKHLRGITKFREIPIIFLTALEGSTDIVEGFRVGGNDYVPKPFNKEVLMTRIKHQLSLSVAKRIIVKKTIELKNTIISRDKMYSVIAHDIRSPMASMSMIMNMLLETLDKETIGKDKYEIISMANQITEDIFSLLDNLLKWTKSQTGNLTPIFQDIDIADIVKGIVEVYNNVASVKGITIELQSIPVAEVSVDIDMLKTCIRNLISNAIKYSYSNNKIIVRLQEEAKSYIISVQDFGCGMNKENTQKLLHTDTHFSTYGTAQEEGSGLGLLLVQAFINKNGGKLKFETEENVGSTFYLSIPKPKSKQEIDN